MQRITTETRFVYSFARRNTICQIVVRQAENNSQASRWLWEYFVPDHEIITREQAQRVDWEFVAEKIYYEEMKKTSKSPRT